MTPLEFCEARITEDEAAARAVKTWGTGAGNDPVFRHIYRHDPATELRRCIAQRIILADAPQFAGVLATTWETHADYDATWGE